MYKRPAVAAGVDDTSGDGGGGGDGYGDGGSAKDCCTSTFFPS